MRAIPGCGSSNCDKAGVHWAEIGGRWRSPSNRSKDQRMVAPGPQDPEERTLGERRHCLKIRGDVRIALAICMLAMAASNASAAEPSVSAPPATETVVVATQRLPVQTLIDRKVYTLTDNLLKSFGTVRDVLGDIPSVTIDPGGALSLRGDSSVVVLIDGKPSPMFSGGRVGETLQSLPAAAIDRIEVITTPPAQYQAAGAAGVINLVTRKRKSSDASSVRASAGSEGRSMVGVDFRRQRENLDVAGSLGFRDDSRRKVLESEFESPVSGAASTLTTRNSLVEHNQSEVHSASLNAEYLLGDRSSVYAAASYLNHAGPRTYRQVTSTRDPSGALVSSTERLSAGRDPETISEAQVAFVQKLERQGEELSFSAHRGASLKTTGYDYSLRTLLPVATATAPFLVLDEQQTQTEVGADYVLPISEGVELKAGYLYEHSVSGFRDTFGERSQVAVGGAAGSDDFRMRQSIHAGYLSYKARIESWRLLAGVRIEGAEIDGNVPTSGFAFRDRYVGAFPSLHAERPVTDSLTLHVGASRRVTRPGPQQLNPNLNREYSLIQRAGNPRLRPGYTQSYELGIGGLVAGRLNYEVTAYYRRNRDSAIGVVDYLGNGVSVSTQSNLFRDDFAGLEVATDGRLGTRLTYSVSADAFRGEVQAGALGRPGLRSSSGVNAKIKIGYKPTERDSAQLNLNRIDGRVTAQGYDRALTVVNLGYRRQLRPRFHALATVSNVLDGQRTESLLSTPDFTGRLVRAIRGPIIYVGLDWSSAAQDRSEPEFDYQK